MRLAKPQAATCDRQGREGAAREPLTPDPSPQGEGDWSRERREAFGRTGRLTPAARLVVALVGVLALGGRPASGADGLRMENALPLAPPRAGGAVYLTGELQWDRPDLLEGRLRFLLRGGPSAYVAIETDPIVLTAGGAFRFRQVIPVPSDAAEVRSADVEVSFLSEEEKFDLGSIPIGFPPQGTWETVLLVAEPTEGTSVASVGVLRKELELPAAFPASDDALAFTRPVTYAPTLPAGEFPEQSLAYCAFDMVALPAEAFQRMTARKLDMTADWVRAGGAVCVNADGPLEPKHADFLNGLFRDAGAGPFLRDEKGRIAGPEGTRDGAFAAPAGLGYAAVIVGPLAEFDFRSAAWRTAHARLWRLRAEHVQARSEGRRLATVQNSPPVYTYVNGQQVEYPSSQFNTWNTATPSFGSAVVSAFKPKELRLLPGWAVVTLLFGYVAVVGPLDYYLLGRLRLRRWTWVTFPAVTLALTAGVVMAANALMSGNDYRRAVEVIDLDAKGEPVRRTRLEMLFQGSGQTVVHEVKRAYVTPLDRRHFGPSEENAAPTGPYEGTYPSRYVAPQRLAKWTPQVNRTFEIAPEVEMPPIDWGKIEGESSTAPVPLPGGRTAFVSRGKEGQAGGAGLLGFVSDQTVFNCRMPYGYGYPQATGESIPFLQAATFLPSRERGSVQYQRSPLGFGRLDDLPFLDSTDPSAEVLVLWTVDAEGNVTVFRKPVRAAAKGG